VQWPSLNLRRVFCNVVALPDGRLFVVGGADKDHEKGEPVIPVYTPEIFDPAAQTPQWQTLASHQSRRVYHSWALLLPDARVMVGGGRTGPVQWDPLLDSDYEIYEPDYLFGNTQPRPVITSVPSGPITYANQFEVDVRVGFGDSVAYLVLVRPASVTHSFNSEQRVLGLAKTTQWCNLIPPGTFSTCRFTVTAPPDGNYAPPGYYMLFALNEEGYPSEAAFVQLL